MHNGCVRDRFGDRALESTTTGKPRPESGKEQESEIDEYHERFYRVEYETRNSQRIGGATRELSRKRECPDHCLQHRDTTRKADESMLEAQRARSQNCLRKTNDDLDRAQQSQEYHRAQATGNGSRCSRAETSSESPCLPTEAATEILFGGKPIRTISGVFGIN